MKTIKVKSCVECPFSYTEYDDFSTGDSHLMVCTLALYTRAKNHIIDSWGYESDDQPPITTPEWCPLDNITITKEAP